MKVTSAIANKIERIPTAGYWGYDSNDSYFDTKEFKAYCAAVNRIVIEFDNRGVNPTVRQINEAMGDDLRLSWQQDALDTLTKVTHVSPVRYAPALVVEIKKWQPMDRVFRLVKG